MTNTKLFSIRNSCRYCEGDLFSVLDLGNIHISTFLDTNDNPPPKVPIELMECKNCGLMQLHHTVAGDVIYREYWYQSGLNKAMVDALKDVVIKTLEFVEINNGDVVVDIGTNDGTLFRQYPEYLQDSVTMIGYEPSNVGELAKNACDILIQDYFSRATYPVDKLAKVVTSVAMFYDLEDPHTFVEDVRSILAVDGVWTIQLMDLISMLKTNDFPNLCHEHLLYYKLLDIIRLLADHGLDVFDCEYNEVNGSSLRVYVCHSGKRTISKNVITGLIAEDHYLATHNVAKHFKTAVENVRDQVVSYIRELVQNGDTVAVLGASTKGNTILQYFGLTSKDIVHAAEINTDKFGKFTIGTNIPIIPQQESLDSRPNYYLILPWGFLPNFLNRFEHYLRDGGAFIVPLPEPAVYTYEEIGITKWHISSSNTGILPEYKSN